MTQTEGTIPIDLIQNVLRRPYRERLRVLVAGLGTGLAGRSDDLQEVLRRAHPGLRETSKVLRILGAESQTIQQLHRRREHRVHPSWTARAGTPPGS